MQNIKELIKYEYENGSSIKVLAEKYSQKVGTIKSWISREKWIKKKQNTATSKRKNATTKRNLKKEVAMKKDAQIKHDILEGKSKDEILETHGIQKSTYYQKAKSIRELRLENTKEYLKEIVEEVYQGKLKDILKNGEKAKLNLAISSIRETGKEDIDYKKITNNENAYNSITKMLVGIMRNGDMVTAYEMGLIEQQLKEEELQQEKIDIEKSKKKEIETVDLTIVEDYK